MDKSVTGGSLSRRSFLQLTGFSVTAMAAGPALLSGCSGGSGSGGEPTQMVVAGGGGDLTAAYRKVYFDPFTEKTGIEIVETPNDAAKLRSMVEFGDVEWDVAQLDPVVAAAAGSDDLLEKLDYDTINTDDLPGDLPRDFYLPCDFAALALAWNTDAISGQGPSDWSALFDTDKFSGLRGFWDQPFQTLEVVLLADGVPPDKLYPIDVDRALKALEPIKDDIRWWTSGAESAQMLINGEVNLSAMWNGRVEAPKESGAAVDFTLQNALLVADCWAVPKGSPNKDKAMEFIDFCMQPERQSELAKHIPYGPANPKAFDSMDEQSKARVPNAPGNKYATVQDFDWWAQNQDKVLKTWNDWISS